MTSNALALPTAAELARERDPSKRLLALVEPASRLLVRATALEEVNEIRSQAAGMERYARAIRLSTEAIGAAQIIARRAEIRMGELLGPAVRGRPPRPEKFRTKEISPPQRRHEFRQMADHAPTVEEVLAEAAPEGKATRGLVLRAIKRESMRETSEMNRRKIDQSPINEMLHLKTDLARMVNKLRRIQQDYGQAFSAATLAREVKELCRELGELLP